MMRSGLVMLACAVNAATLSGCEIFTPPTAHRQIVEAGDSKLYVVDYEASRRATYVTAAKEDGKTELRFVAEPPPDVALAKLVELSGKVTPGEAGTGGEFDTKFQTTVHALTRAIAVSVLRDGGYRLAEAYANGAIDEATYRAQVDKLIDGVITIALAEVKQAEAEAEAARARQMEAGQQQLRSLERLMQSGVPGRTLFRLFGVEPDE